MINEIRNFFKSINKSYFLRYYFFAVVLVFIFYKIGVFDHNMGIPEYLLFTIDFIVYPFAVYLWDEIVGFILGDVWLIQNINIVTLLFKFMFYSLVYICSILLFPFGLIILFFRYKKSG